MEFTFDKEIALDSLQKIKAMLDLVTERASVVETPNDFLCSPRGMLRLDAICMNLIALGETLIGMNPRLALAVSAVRVSSSQTSLRTS